MPAPLSVIIPVYNEGENILATLRQFNSKVKTPSDIYIVHDFEEDTTLPILKKHSSELPPIKLLKNKYGRGVLNAIKTGLETAEGEAVLVTMADGSDEYEIVDQMFEKFKQGFAVVCGSRYMRGGRQVGGPLLKKTLSRIAGISLYYLARIPTHDISNSFKLYSKKFLNEITIESSGGFEIGMEITVKAYVKGYKIAELPTFWRDRASGKSNFKLWKWLPRYLHWYFYFFRNRP